MVGDRSAENAAWSYPEPLGGAPPLAGYLAFFWDRVDRWLEEDEEVFVHPRDPYHRVDVIRSSRHVTVSLNGELLAESVHGDDASFTQLTVNQGADPRPRLGRPR